MPNWTQPNPTVVPNRAPVQTATPMGPGPQMAPPPPSALAMPQAPSNVMDMILQAVSEAGPRFIEKAQQMFEARMPQLDQSIAAMKANNAATAQRLSNMKLGAEALDAGVPPEGPIAPLDLFGPPRDMPRAPMQSQAPAQSPQDFMASHNARTPKKPQGQAQASSPPASPPRTPSAPMSSPMVPSAPQAQMRPPMPPMQPGAAGQPPSTKQQMGEILGALGGKMAAQGAQTLPTNWLRPSKVPPRKGAAY